MLQTEFAFPGFLKNRYFILITMIIVAIAVGFAGTLNPLIAIGAVLIFCLILLFLSRPNSPVILVTFIIYTNAAVVIVKFHGIPELVGYALPSLLLIPFIWQVIVSKQPIKINFVFILMMVYFSIITLGSVFSRDINLAIPSLINFMAEGIGLYFLYTNTIRTPKLLKQVVWSLLIAGALIGGLSLWQQLTGTFDNNYGGFAQVSGQGFATEETIQGEVIQLRVSGSIGEKNRYAQIMLMLVPIGLFLAWGGSKRSRLVALILTGLIFVGGSLAFSRGAQVGFLLLILIMTFMRYIKVQQLLIVLLGIILFLLAFPQNAVRFTTLGDIFSSQEEGGLRNADGSIQGRATEMLAALLVFGDHPIIGVGPGMFRYEMQEYSRIVSLRNITNVREAHSLYAGELAETGILGFITLMAIFLYTLYRLAIARTYWLKRNRNDLANLCTGFFLAIIGYLTTGIFLHMSYIRFLWLLIALAIVASEFREVDDTKDNVAKQNKKELYPSLGMSSKQV